MSLADDIISRMAEQHLTLAVAESCTGGLIGHLLTNVPGSSAVLLGDAVVYSNLAKERLIGVPHEELEQYGAVSEQVARSMARGTRATLGAAYGLGTTGILGPTGATPGKPIGLTFIAVSGPAGERCERHLWPHDRLHNKEATADAALQLLARALDLVPPPAPER